MSRDDEHWLGDPLLEPDWRDRLVLGAVAADVVCAVVATVVLAVLDRPTGGVFLATSLLAVPCLLVVLVVSLRRRPRGDAGQVLMRAGYHAPVLLSGAVAGGVPAVVLAGFDDGLDLPLAGAAFGLFVGGLLGTAVLLLVGGCLRFPLANPGLPWHLRLSLPLALASATAMVAGAALGVDPDADLGRRLAGLVRALSGEAGVRSAAWLWVGRAGAAGFVAGLVLLAVALRRPRPPALT